MMGERNETKPNQALRPIGQEKAQTKKEKKERETITQCQTKHKLLISNL